MLSAEATGATDWRAYANLLPFQLCRGAFCADCSQCLPHTQVGRRATSRCQFEGRYVFLVAFGAGQTGTVSLRLTPPA